MGTVLRIAFIAAILVCWCLIPLQAFAKVANGYVDTGARLFELDGKPAVIFKSWYRDDTLAPCDFVFASSETAFPTSMQDWKVCSIDRSAQMMTGCFEYDDLSAATIAGLPTYAQYIQTYNGIRSSDQIRFVQAIDPEPRQAHDWRITILPQAAYSTCKLAVIDSRPAVVYTYEDTSTVDDRFRHGLRLAWARSTTPMGIDYWDIYDLAQVNEVFTLGLVDCESKPVVFFLGRRNTQTAAAHMYVAQLDPASGNWDISQLPNTLRPSREQWSAAGICGQVFFSFIRDDRLVVTQVDEEQVLDPASWRISVVDNGVCPGKAEITSLNNLPAVAYLGKGGITIAQAETLAPQGQSNWIITPLDYFTLDFSLAEIAGKPAITFVEHGERCGVLRYAYIPSEAGKTSEDWQVTTVFAGWKGQSGNSSRAAAADPLAAVIFTTSSNTRTIQLTSSLQDSKRTLRLLVLILSVVFLLVFAAALIAFRRRRSRPVNR